MTLPCLMTILGGGHAIAINHWTGGSPAESHVELWQVINLVGTPLLAMLFLPPVIEDLQAWLRSRREEPR